MMMNALTALLCCLSLFASAAAKSAIANFYNAGVQGTIRFSQDTDSDPVTVEVNLNGLQGLAGGYHVHQFPVNFGGSGFISGSTRNGCAASITAGHYNPLRVTGGDGEAGNYDCSAENPEGCEAGDLSGRFGSLKDLESISETFVDSRSGLTLFGDNSIVGRSIVIHESADSSRFVCATIFEENVTYKKYVSTFDASTSGLEGTVTFMQNENDPEAESIVFINLGLGGKVKNSLSLDWSLADHRIFNRLASSLEEKCDQSSIGSTFVNLKESFGQIDLQKGERTKLLLTVSPNLLSVVGDSISTRTLVFSSDSFTDCADFGKSAVVVFEGSEEKGVEGSITFTQASAEDPVLVDIDLFDLRAEVDGFHVHTLPVIDSCASTTGHFNPLLVEGGAGVAGTYNCSPSNPVGCEAGDLSGRFGGLLGRNEVSYSFVDSAAGLTLFGENSIVGRSVVVHEVSKARRVCANIYEVGHLTGFTTDFADRRNVLVGEMSFTQRLVDPDAETTIFVNLASGDNTQGHMYHVHEKPVASDGNCASTAGHFNPTAVVGGNNFATFGDYLCSSNARNLCEVGDISGKLEKLNFPSQTVQTEVFLPLSGYASMAGKSITVHAEGGGGSRIDCASLRELDFAVPRLPEAKSESSGDDEFRNGWLIAYTVMITIAFIALAVYALEVKTLLGIKVHEEKTKFEV